MVNRKLFRAKDKQNKWVYGSLIEDYATGMFYILENKPEDMDYPYIDDIGFIDGRVTPVQKWTICQYIEELGCQGDEFYEGDIIRCTRRHGGEFFDNAILISSSFIIEDGSGRMLFPQDTLDYEIVGNVIDNPELLSEISKRWNKNYGWVKKSED